MNPTALAELALDAVRQAKHSPARRDDAEFYCEALMRELSATPEVTDFQLVQWLESRVKHTHNECSINGKTFTLVLDQLLESLAEFKRFL